VAKKARLPTDVNSRAKAIVDLATSEEPVPESDAANPTTGSAGGKARAKSLTAKERSEIARKAARARWADD
jgi:hypothetical protein